MVILLQSAVEVIPLSASRRTSRKYLVLCHIFSSWRLYILLAMHEGCMFLFDGGYAFELEERDCRQNVQPLLQNIEQFHCACTESVAPVLNLQSGF